MRSTSRSATIPSAPISVPRPGAINLISGNTHGATPAELTIRDETIVVAGHDDRRSRPGRFDDCSKPDAGLATMSGRNMRRTCSTTSTSPGAGSIGGFRPTPGNNGTAFCDATSVNLIGKTVTDLQPASRAVPSITRAPPTRITCRRARSL